MFFHSLFLLPIYGCIVLSVTCELGADQPSEMPSKLSLHRENRSVLSGLP